ncbi:Alpha/Beta hydrolase protein [Mycena olivaceomarginata]|nr:Alpha/Beta hydrolase protein [Mycena olivaceomarginata]
MLGALFGVLLSGILAVDAAALSTVTLDYGTFTGLTNSTNGGEHQSPPSTHLGSVNATALGFACIATTQKNSGATTDEDCLFGNVASSISTVTVLLTLFDRSISYKYDGGEYRLGQFGFLSGQLNAGLLDQRAALEWVQTYIGKFGGDKSRSNDLGVSQQGQGLFPITFLIIAEGGEKQELVHRVAIGDSPPLIYLPLTLTPSLKTCSHNSRVVPDVEVAGNGPATMACLRAAPTGTIASLYPFGPIADGNFIRERPIEAFGTGISSVFQFCLGSNWSASLDNPAANTSSPDATETTVYNFIAGQYPTINKASFQTALRLYPLADYQGSFSLQGQQIYGEMSWDNPTLGSNHADELDAFLEDEIFDADDQVLVTAMRQYWTSFATSGVLWPRGLLHGRRPMALRAVPESFSIQAKLSWSG